MNPCRWFTQCALHPVRDCDDHGCHRRSSFERSSIRKKIKKLFYFNKRPISVLIFDVGHQTLNRIMHTLILCSVLTRSVEKFILLLLNLNLFVWLVANHVFHYTVLHLHRLTQINMSILTLF